MNLETGSSAWYVAGARFVDRDSIVNVQFAMVREVLEFGGGSRIYVIDLGGIIYADAGRLFADREEADAEAIRLQQLKIEKARELLEVHTRWLDRLENP
jgi:hypothetical protein